MNSRKSAQACAAETGCGISFSIGAVAWRLVQISLISVSTHALSSLSLACCDRYLLQLMGRFDSDGSGSVCREEFHEVYEYFQADMKLQEEMKLTSLGDNDGNGCLSSAEVTDMIVGMGYDVDEAHVKEVIKRFDSDGSGNIEVAELKPMLEFFKSQHTRDSGGGGGGGGAGAAEAEPEAEVPPAAAKVKADSKEEKVARKASEQAAKEEAKEAEKQEAKRAGAVEKVAALEPPEGLSAMEKARRPC